MDFIVDALGYQVGIGIGSPWHCLGSLLTHCVERQATADGAQGHTLRTPGVQSRHHQRDFGKQMSPWDI